MKITQKPSTQFCGGVPISVQNEVMQNSVEFYISYSASARSYGCRTTALVLNDPQITKFYILCGDHREAYKSAQTLSACMQYYKNNKALQHEYSDKVE